MSTKTRPLYMLLTRDPPQNKGHIQTESEGVASSLETQREGGREPSLQGKPLGSEQTLPRLSRLHHWELHTSPRYRPDLYVYSSLQASQVAQWKGSCLQWRKCGLHPWVRKIPWRRAWQPTHIFAWRIPWTEEPGGLQSTGSQRVGYGRSD